MELKNFYAQDANGNILPGAACSLYLPGTTTLVTGLQDATGKALANPFAADTTGLIAFAAPNGTYDLYTVMGTKTGTIRVQFIDVDKVSADAASAAASAKSANDALVGGTSLIAKEADERKKADQALNDLISGLRVDLSGVIQELVDLSDYSDASKGAQMIGYYAGIAGAKGRYAAEKLRECISVKDFGAKGDGVTDDLLALIQACASGVPLWWPAGEYMVSDTLQPTTVQSWSTFGRTKISAAFAQGSAVRPVLDFKAKVLSNGDFVINHKADTGSYGQPAPYQSNPIAGTAVLVQGDWSKISNWQIENAWDNGIAAVRLDDATGKEVAGSPKYGKFEGIQTRYCGVGEHDRLTPGKIGAGVDVASASAWLVSNCTDAFSYIGHILDVGAGASAQFVNCLAFYTKVDTNNPANGSGHGFYTGSSESTFTNCYSIGSEKRGWWLDAVGNDYVNCGAYISQEEGLFIKAGQLKGQFRLKGCGAKQANTYDAVMIDCSARNITELVLDLQTTGSNHRYGVNATKGSTSNTIEAYITGSVTGTTGKVNRGDFDIGTRFVKGKKTAVNRDVAGFEYDILGRWRVGADRANQSYKVAIFGDSTDNGTAFFEDYATPAKRMAMGYDPVNDCFVMQAIHAGTAKKPMMINPSGGAVGVGMGTWDNPVLFGSNRVWFDTSGVMRTKATAPTSATDGTSVGSQS